MKPRVFLIPVLVFWFSATAFSQQAKLEGRVFDDRDQVVSRVRIIVPGSQASVTDSKGHFSILFPQSVLPGKPARIEVVKPDWVIYEPMFGNCVTQSKDLNYEPLRVVIVRKSSALALSTKRLSQVIARWASDNVKLRAQVGSLKQEVDEYAFLREYAKEYGFTLEQVRTAAETWAQVKSSDDKEEWALKEYWQKNYGTAAQLAKESAQVADEELKQANKKTKETSLKLIRRFELAGNSYFEQNKFREALAVYNEIDIRFESKALSKENFVREWAESKVLVGTTLRSLGERVSGAEGIKYLNNAVVAHRAVLETITREQFPLEWATAQENLGNALVVLSQRSGGPELLSELADAMLAYQSALEVFTRAQNPQGWARTLVNAGIAAYSLGERIRAPEHWPQSIEYLKYARTFNLAALQVFTRAGFPEQWATIESNLGNVLWALSRRTSGAQEVEYLNAAASAYRAALEVRQREKLPQDWAATQVNLANVLLGLSAFANEPESTKYLNDAEAALRRALEIVTREQAPEIWATLQNNLGEALRISGQRLGGDDGNKALNDAVVAYRLALEELSSENSAQVWLDTQFNLARALFELHNWSGAAEAYKNVLRLSNNQNSFDRATSLYHDRLFNFDEAFVLYREWLAREPNDIAARAKFAQAHFTTGRFAECGQRVNVLLTQTEIDPSTKAALRAIEVASLLADNKASEAPGKIDALIAEIAHQPYQFRVEWNFNGTKHYIDQNVNLAVHRVWLGMLFDAMTQPDRDAMLKALEAVRTSLDKKP